MQRFKALLQPKVLRMLALGLILLASLLLLIQSQYGTSYLVAMGTISRNPQGGGAIIGVIAAEPRSSQKELAVSASELLVKSIEKAGDGTEFLAVVHKRGEELVFERIFLLLAPQDSELQGPSSQLGQLGLAVGSKPELVEMVGLDRFGYLLEQPAWAKEKLPNASMVYYQVGNLDAAKDVLDGKLDFVPDLYVLDAQNRIMGMRRLGQRLLPLPELMRKASWWLYGAALVLAVASFLSYKWLALVSAGKRIWDHVSMRGRKASN